MKEGQEDQQIDLQIETLKRKIAKQNEDIKIIKDERRELLRAQYGNDQKKINEIQEMKKDNFNLNKKYEKL